ncbi:MAG TPA: hypothetical protein PL124_06185 [Candidatus Cloacimonadota bacterium]|nr:hypothetical protein [Candidatus Cloacimonadota bacterium]HPS38983.1 hypothetical protein [Candidatus Cloacimonadota bacterium]
MIKDTHDYFQEVDPEELTGVSDAFKLRMAQIGYKPYRSSRGAIKWTNQASRLYRASQRNKSFRLFRKSSRIPEFNAVHKRFWKNTWHLVMDNFLFILLVVILGIGLYLILTHNITI